MYRIVTYPHPALVKPCAPVTEFDNALKTLAKDMFSTMHEHKGIGLAANQIAIDKSICVIEIEQEKQIFINPVITNKSVEIIGYEEGCLSFPQLRQDRKRAQNITVKWQDLEGNFKTQNFSDLWAICLQHEIDHLNGITFIDELSDLKKQFALKKYAKLKR